MYKNKSVTLIMPTKNEYENLKILLKSIPSYVDEIIVVDGNSTDGTYSYLQKSNLVSRVILQKSSGKGDAIRIGLQSATKELIICMDADGSMSPEEFPIILDTMIEKGADIAKGSRYLDDPLSGSDDLSKFRSLGNLFLLNLANKLYKSDWTELAYGFFGLKRSIVKNLGLSNIEKKTKRNFHFLSYSHGFEIEAILFCRAIVKSYKVEEFPSFERNRWNGTSNLKAIPDGIRILLALLIERFKLNKT